MTKLKFIKAIKLYNIELYSVAGLYEQYPHPFLTPSLYSPHPLSIERWGYS